ncbi:MAG: hypothetical protein ACR2G7_03570 [Acidimicrobiales bacterium]
MALALVVLSALTIGAATTVPGFVRVAIAAPLTALALVVTVQDPRRSILFLLTWLAVFATVRRVLLGAGAASNEDPLLLVAPVVVGLLLIVAVRQGAMRQRSRLTSAVLLLSGLIVAGALNPLQGSPAAGLAGLLFVLVPVLWFWIGRTLVDDDLLQRILRLVGMFAIGAAAYGLFQVYRGFPPWDALWIETKGYNSLRVGDALRQFASFSSAAEYVGFMAIGVIIWVLRVRRSPGAIIGFAVLSLLGWALAVASVRGVLLSLPVALGMVFAASRGFGVARTVVFGLAGLVALGFLVSFIDPATVGGDRTEALLNRQVTGISDPFNPKVSTLPVHIDLVIGGFEQALRNPVGRGLGTVTVAGARYGTETAITETDPSNMAVALGLPGFLAYGAVVVLGMTLALRRARASRDFLSLAALGILLVTSFQWLNGGAYAVAPLPWLVLGWLDRPDGDRAVGDIQAADASELAVN